MFDHADLRIASAAYNKLLKFNSERRFKAQSPSNAVLFHYTTADGLKGIIQDNCLHATSAYFLNDSSEIRYGYGILDRAIQEWQMRNREVGDSLSARLVDELKERSSRDVSRIHQARPVYLACFCESDNLLSQWRAYGQAGGYSLGFHVANDRTATGMRPEHKNYTAEWIKVEYDDAKQVTKCRAILDLLSPIFDNEETVRAISNLASHQLFALPRFRTIIEEICLDEIVGFKRDAFYEEQEWRLLSAPASC